jgi:hypothetical protein
MQGTTGRKDKTEREKHPYRKEEEKHHSHSPAFSWKDLAELRWFLSMVPECAFTHLK